MITLYHAPRSRSSRFIWLLEELEAPYRLEQVSILRGTGEGAPAADSYKAIHPHRKVPAIADDGTIIFESAAIALYLTDAFPKNGIGPTLKDPKRGPYLTWLAYYAGVMEPAFVSKFLNVEVKPGATGWAPVPDVMDYVNKVLGAQPYLLGERFSAADILVGSAFALFLGSPLLPSTDLLMKYVDALKARPAYQRALEKEAAIAPAP